MKLSQRELLQAVKTLATLTRKDYPLAQALKGMGQDQGPWLQVSEDLASGDELGEALHRYPNVFSPFFSSMLESAENSGRATQILGNLGKWLEASERLREKILSALSYPTLLLACLCLECAVLCFYGLPEVIFPLIYAPDNLLVPDFLKSFSGLIGVVFLVASATLLMTTHKIEKVVPYLQSLTPFRSLLLRADLSLWARGVAAFLQAGKPLDEALESCTETAWDPKLRQELTQLSKQVQQGSRLSEAVSQMDSMDPGVRWAITAGESREDLPATLLLSAERLERQLLSRCELFLSTLEPIAVITVGLLSALVLVPFWWSMYQFTGNFAP